MSVYDFKRLILTEKRKPFFLDRDIENNQTIAKLYETTDIIHISFEINNWYTYVSELNSDQVAGTSASKDITVDELLNQIIKIKPDYKSLALIEEGETDIKQMKEFSKEE